MFKKIHFQIWRLTTTSGNKRSYQDTGEKFVGTMEPVDIEFMALSGNSFAKTHKIFSTQIGSSVAETDRLVVGSETYEVKGRQKYDHVPRHLELMVEQVIKQ